MEKKNRGVNTKNKEMFYVFLLKNARKDYYENICLSNLTDSYKFWKTMNPVFDSKVKVLLPS